MARNTKPFRLWQCTDRGGGFFVRYPGGGWQSTGCTDRKAAEQQANKHLGVIEIAAQLGQPVFGKDARAHGTETIAVFARDFFKWTGKTPEYPWCRRKLAAGQ